MELFGRQGEGRAGAGDCVGGGDYLVKWELFHVRALLALLRHGLPPVNMMASVMLGTPN
jgi:hypothetical protein